MKILSIIPTCEGSEQLPNKNFRVIGGKPLIYYVIRNAQTSEFITDVLVTSNSSSVLTIAKQMGVLVHKRDEALANKEVALEPVIYDACLHVDLSMFDYVVIMQSISPTLSSKTLDDAIRTCIYGNWDTVLSVINKAHFYWQGSKTSPIPFHTKRTSRHKLPPFYGETGAFCITKTKFIKKNNRFGDKVMLYELCSDEAVEIYSFGDLKLAENILCKKKVAFYVNGGNEIGLGHIYRVKELADEFYSKPDIYYDTTQTKKESFGDTTHTLIPVDGNKGLHNALKYRQYDIFINDVLSTSTEYMMSLKNMQANSKIINFEDEGKGADMADLVINDLYEGAAKKNIRYGHMYFLASKLFLLTTPIAIKPIVENVLITFGGADPQNYTDRLLGIIRDMDYLHFYVVMGGAKHGATELMQIHGNLSHVDMMHNITNMPEIISKCDIAISSRGRTGFELALMGIPTISLAQHEREDKHSFIDSRHGFTYLGINPSDDFIRYALEKLANTTIEERLGLQKKMLNVDLRNGRKNIMSLIEQLD